jgi:GAF domain-containing protein/HAMP domain-containing protein
VTAVSELTSKSGDLMALQQAAGDLRAAIADQETFAFDYAVAGAPESLDGVRAAAAVERATYDRLAAPGVPPDIRVAAGHVRELATAWRQQWLDPYVDGLLAGRTPDPTAMAEIREVVDEPLEAALIELNALVVRAEDAWLDHGMDVIMQLGAVLVPIVLILLLLIGGTWWWVSRTVSGPLLRLNATARAVTAGADSQFVAESDDEIGELAVVLERLRRDAADRYRTARTEADRAAVFNQLAELISFAQDEDALVSAAVRTLQRVAPTQRGDVMLVNNSTNRLLVSAGWGADAPGPGLVPVDRIDRCPGIRRATAYIAADLADDLSVRCPAHPVDRGSVACVPMPALGTIMGVIHLEREEPGSFDAETVAVVARVAEQVALAIANARLMHTMEGLAMSDPLTGLRNPRYFDGYLEQELAEAARDGERTALLMLDIDHFKVFNDTHGHPAGDEALRTFARVLKASVRASDVIARYGGEEFVVSLHHTRLEDAQLVAE